MTPRTGARPADRPEPERRSLLLRLADWAYAPRAAGRRDRPVRNWLLTRLGRAPERVDLTTDCRQCGQWDRVTVFRLGQRRARYWCQWCGAVVAVPDRAGLRPVNRQRDVPATPTPRPPEADPALREVMPAAMLTWLARYRRQPVTMEQLDRATIYQLYRRWDAHLRELPADQLRALAVAREPPPQAGLPTFSGTVGAVQDACYRSELAVAALIKPADGIGGADPAAVWQRVEHARRWLALRGREWSWVHGRLPDGRLAEPDVAEVEAAVAALRSGSDPSPDLLRAARAALLGTGGGPRFETLASLYSPEWLLAALEAYLDTGARPLRDDLLARLAAPLALPQPAGQ